MARELKAGRACALYAYRDVRDVVFSLMHKRGKTFEQILRQGMIHQILANDRFWMAQPNVLVQRYDDLISEPARGVTELAIHLGFRLEAGEAERIAALYSQESNRARTEALKQRLEQAGVDLESGGNIQICDPSSLLHWNHMEAKVRPPGARWRRRGRVRSCTGSAAAGSSRTAIRLKGRPALKWDLSMQGSARVASKRSRCHGRLVNFLVRTTSLRFPKTARTVKRLLGMPVETNAGATVWADPIPARSDAAKVSGDAA